MSHQLESKVNAVRRRARGLVLLYGLGRLLAGVLSVILLVTLADYVLRIQDRGVLLISSLCVWGVAAWCGYRYVIGGLLVPLRRLQVAEQVERRFPELSDRLTTSIEFLRQADDDPYAGSATLRHAVIEQTTSEAENLDFRQAIDTRPVRRMGAVAATVCLIAAVLVAIDPASARLALGRLARPLSAPAWPKRNHLAFRNPIRTVAYGQPFVAQLFDAQGADLPDDVFIYYRTEASGGKPELERQQMQPVVGGLSARREQVTRPFSYRATGGDDQTMPWIDVEVVEPPVVEDLTITLRHPEYTGWLDESSERDITALVGTRVEFAGKTTKPVEEVLLHLDGGATHQASVADDGLSFTLGDAEPVLVEKSGTYWFELKGREGLTGGGDTKYEIRATNDLPPAVSIDSPQGNLFVVATAVVPLRISVKDDVAIRDASIQYSRGDQTDAPESTQPVHSGPASVPAGPREPKGNEPSPSDAASQRPSKTLSLDYSWDLTPLGLEPGSQITFSAAASDYRPQLGRTQPRRITIITPDELQDRIAQRQALILGEIARLLDLQKETRGQTTSLENQVQDVGSLRQQDVDRLQTAELTQRQVERGLTSPSEGVLSQIDALIEDLHNNRLDSADVSRQMERLSSELARLDKNDLPVIERALTSALKGAQNVHQSSTGGERPDNQRPADASLAAELNTAGKHQDEVISTLEQLATDLAQWGNYRKFQREIARLRDLEKQLTEETAALGRRTLSSDAKELPAQDRADLKSLADRQKDLGRELEKIQQNMREMANELEDDDPLAADTIADALEEALQRSISGQMRKTAQNIEQNQVGQALDQQRQLDQNLEEVLDILANRRENELNRLVKKLREAEQQLADMRDKQEGLKKKIDQTKDLPEEERRPELERLAREERDLEKQTQRFSRRLERLQAEQAGRTTARASQSLGQAGESGEQGNASAAAEQAQNAQSDLEEAQEQLAERRRQAESDLAEEQIAKLQDSLVELARHQQGVVDEIVEVDQLRQKQGRLTRPQAVSVNELGHVQLSLAEEVDQLIERLTEAPAFVMALEGAGGDMRVAADLLDRRQTGDETQQAAKEALRRCLLLLEALQQDEAEQGDEAGDGGGGGGGGGGDGIPAIAQIKLIKLMQIQINERTRELYEQAAAQGKPTASQQREFESLSKTQGALADLVRNLMAADPVDPEKALDPMPGATVPEVLPEEEDPVPDADDLFPIPDETGPPG